MRTRTGQQVRPFMNVICSLNSFLWEQPQQSSHWGSRVPAVAQRDQRCLGSTGTQAQSLAQLSGLGIRHYHGCSLGCDCSSDLIPGPGTPYAARQPEKKKERKKLGLQGACFRKHCFCRLRAKSRAQAPSSTTFLLPHPGHFL